MTSRRPQPPSELHMRSTASCTSATSAGSGKGDVLGHHMPHQGASLQSTWIRCTLGANADGQWVCGGAGPGTSVSWKLRWLLEELPGWCLWCMKLQ